MNNTTKQIIQKTSLLSFFILINKPIGFLRDILQNRYFGIGALSDAYLTAWRIPNIFRRIFGEGLLSSVLLPELITLKNHHSKSLLNQVLSAIIISIQTIILLVCITISYHSTTIMHFLSPGNYARTLLGGPFLGILIFFTFFMSWSAILGIALQLEKNFYTGPQSQFLVNIALCSEFYLAHRYNFDHYSTMILLTANGIIVLLFHYYFYKKHLYIFQKPSQEAWAYTWIFFKRFFMALLSSLILESNTLISLSLSSYLQAGLLTINEILLTLIRIPQQVFGSALATISHVDITNHIIDKSSALHDLLHRINTLLFYASSITILGIFVGGELFFTLFFYFSNIAIPSAFITQIALCLLFLSISLYPALLSRIMNNILYAHKDVPLATIISFITVAIQNIFLYYTICTYQLSACIASYIVGDIIRFLILMITIKKKYGINMYEHYLATYKSFKKHAWYTIGIGFLMILITYYPIQAITIYHINIIKLSFALIIILFIIKKNKKLCR
jgi:putative peptidoglycan lipid II flippase